MGGYWYVDSQPYSAVLDALIAASNSSQIVLTTGTYSDPGFIASLAASKITGTLTKSQQHAQTAYYDAAGTWTQAQIFNAETRFKTAVWHKSTEATPKQRFYFDEDGTTYIQGHAATPIILRNGSGTDLVSVASNGNTSIAGVIHANYVGANIRIKADGGGLDGALVSDGAGNLFLGDYASLTRGWRINPDGTMATLGTGSTTFNGNVQLESATPTQTWQVSTGATAPTYTEAARQFQIKTWQLNSGDFATTTDLVANSIQYNNHAVRLWVHTHGTANPVLSTTFNADGSTTFNGPITSTKTGKLGDYTVATLPSASANTGYECNVTDSSVTTFGSTVAGGGSNNVKVRSNGTNWTVTGI